VKTKVTVFLLIFPLLLPPVHATDEPLIVTTIGPLDSIVAEAFPGINVVYLIPPGVDPHQYQLGSEQISLLQKAAVIVTTGGHLPVEKKIAELHSEGLIKGRVLLVNDYKRFGFRYAHEYWYGNKVNPHGVWLSPENAIAIVEATAKALSAVNPEMANVYSSEAKRFRCKVEAVEKTLRAAVRERNVTAVVEMPPDQYALEWLGIKVVAAIKPEEEVPALPPDKLAPRVKGVNLVIYGTSSPPNLINASKTLAQTLGVSSTNVTIFWSGKNYTTVLISNGVSVLRALKMKTVIERSGSLNERYIFISLLVGLSLGVVIGMLMGW